MNRGKLDLTKYTQVLNETFNALNIDGGGNTSPDWNHTSPWGFGNPAVVFESAFLPGDTTGTPNPNSPFTVLPQTAGVGGLVLKTFPTTNPDGSTTWHGGCLCSVDANQNGFVIEEGYAEATLLLPGGTAGTLATFWLNTALPGFSDPAESPFTAELDAIEYYGASGSPATTLANYHATMHVWNGPSEIVSARVSTIFQVPAGAAQGFHAYGVDVSRDGVGWYFDRNLLLWTPTPAQLKQPPGIVGPFALILGLTGSPGNLPAAATQMTVQSIQAFRRGP